MHVEKRAYIWYTVKQKAGEPMHQNQKAAVFIMLGQSNAVGHDLPMCREDYITAPLTDVFGLHRAENQSFDVTHLTWRGYESGGMNLAEEQDHTYSVPNCLARQWQDAIDNGQPLPSLYILHIAIGAEGVVGSITEGKVADFLVCSADYSNMRVFLAGKEL